MADAVTLTKGRLSRATSVVAGVLVCFMGNAFVHPTAAQPDTTGTLVIEVTGLTSDEGQVRIAVFDADQRWLKTSVYVM